VLTPYRDSLPGSLTAAEDLATALSVAVRIEPELIRAVRLALFPSYGVETEADLWFSELVRSRGPHGIVFDQDVRHRLQDRLAGRLTTASASDPIHDLGDIIASAHAYLSPALLVEEQATWHAVRGEISAVDDALRPALKAVALERRRGVSQWFTAAWNRLPEAARRSTTAWKIAQVSQQQAAREDGASGSIAPTGLTAEALTTQDLADIVDVLEDTRLLVCRIGADLRVGDLISADGAAAIQVPDTDPRLLSVLGVPSAERVSLSVRRGDTAELWVGLGTIRLQTARGTVFELPPPPAGTAADSEIAAEKPQDLAAPPDTAHCMLVLQAMVQDGDLVPFLGSQLTQSRTEWHQGSRLWPNADDLADQIAKKMNVRYPQPDLPQVAQYARMARGQPRLHGWVRQILTAGYEPEPVHRFLARFPQTLGQLGLEKRYQLIVSTTFDTALESAFLEQKEPFDVAVYMASGTEHAGRFVHLPWGEAGARSIMTPNEYDGFPIRDDGELARTVIVKINGTVDDSTVGYPWKGNYVLTEDDYIDYLGWRRAEEIVPVQILATLRQSSSLFLGYRVRDWTQRVFLRAIWPGMVPGGASWAVRPGADVLEQRFWQRSGVAAYSSSLTDYVAELDRLLREHRDELT
jgi:SIR2-like domain